MRRKFIAGNWKMNGNKAENAVLLRSLVDSIQLNDGVEVAVCVPYPYLEQVERELRESRLAVGAQDVSNYMKGAYTGEVSAGMLKEFSCKYVIVGHSERRTFFGDTDSLVAEKFLAASDAGLMPILCVGETLAEREAGITARVVTSQIEAVLAVASAQKFGQAVIAYEPVWAIGTGRTATPEQAQEVHALIRSRLAREDVAIADAIQILYGGSMKATNATELLVQSDIDGGLIGGASLVAQDFLAIVAACS